MIRAVVRCDGAGPTQAEPGTEVLDVRSTGPEALNLRVAKISDAFPARVPDRARDLVQLASYVYWADQMVSRGGDTDVAGDDWGRRFQIWAPVLDPAFWSRAEVHEALQAALHFLTGDTWRFWFSEATPGAEQLPFGEAAEANVPGADCVLLFSGGADSLSAAVQAVSVSGRQPVLVSHAGSSRIGNRQSKLVAGLRGRVPAWSFPRFAVEVNKRRVREKESTQRSRGFLYASLGVAAAAGFGLTEVLAADNGVVSLGLPLNGQVIGAMSSRTTHPGFLARLNTLVGRVVPTVRVRNPLWDKTRAEALSILTEHRLGELLRFTYSCAAGRLLPNATPHCGQCSQCLDRRVAVVARALEAHDTAYKQDVFREVLTGRALTLGESFIRQACRIAALTKESVLVEFPELLECVTGEEADVDGFVEALADMVIRQSRTTLLALRLERERRGGLCPPPSLLGLFGASGPVAEPVPPAAIPDDVALADDAEARFKKHRLKSRLPVELGEAGGHRTTVIVAGRDAHLTDAEFILLLRLVVAVVEHDDGWEPLGDDQPTGLAYEPWFAARDGEPSRSIEQAAGKLRDRLQPFLGDIKHTHFIEIVRRRVRLSTVPECIRYDLNVLKEHLNPFVKQLAARLESAEQARRATAAG